jgi:hypothetical protein
VVNETPSFTSWQHANQQQQEQQQNQ